MVAAAPAELCGGFRRLTDGLSVGYVVCYVTYLLFPTRSPSHNAAQDAPVTGAAAKGLFHSIVGWLQCNAGVHGNAFPSAHIMLAFTVLVFVGRYFPRYAPWLLLCVLLMCAGAVYDGYHYAVDVIAGAVVGMAVGVGFRGEKENGREQPTDPPGNRKPSHRGKAILV